jgi:hypothetical protein
MGTVVLQLHTFLTSGPDIFERSSAHRMQAVGVQLYTVLPSEPDTIEGSNAYLWRH